MRNLFPFMKPLKHLLRSSQLSLKIAAMRNATMDGIRWTDPRVLLLSKKTRGLALPLGRSPLLLGVQERILTARKSQRLHCAPCYFVLETTKPLIDFHGVFTV